MLSCFSKARFQQKCLINRNRDHKHIDRDFVLSKCVHKLQRYKRFTIISIGSPARSIVHCIYKEFIHLCEMKTAAMCRYIKLLLSTFWASVQASFNHKWTFYLPSIIALHNSSRKKRIVMDVRSIMQAKGRRVGNISSICTLYVTNRSHGLF